MTMFMAEYCCAIYLCQHCGLGGPMVSVVLLYGHFIDAVLTAQRCRDRILTPNVVPFIHYHHRMLRRYNTQLHVARICIQFLEAEDIPVFIPVFGIKRFSILMSLFQIESVIRSRVRIFSLSKLASKNIYIKLFQW